MIRPGKIATGFCALLYLGVAVYQGIPLLGVPTAAAQSFEVIHELQEKWSIFIELGMAVSFTLYPLVTVLLDPKFFLDVTGQSGGDLLSIWQLSRDIMNTIFAFILIGGAMMTVITAKEEYLKKYAMKFVLGVILVNFSWFFPRVILDVSHVLTANIYQIPQMVGTECQYRQPDGSITACKFPKKFKYFPSPEEIKNLEENKGYTCKEFVCYIEDTLNNETNTAQGILAGLMLNHARLSQLNMVLPTGAPAAAADSRDKMSMAIAQIIHAGLQLLLIIFVTLIILGMAIALLVRIPVLWMTMAFMPLMFLGYVLGDLLPEEMNTMKIFKHFVAAAFLPMVMAIPLAVGFVMVNALAFSEPPGSVYSLLDEYGEIIPGVSSLWSLLWVLVSMVVMWKGFKMAVENDKIFGAATSGITRIGDNLGTLAKNAPLNVPFLPMGKGGTSLGEVGTNLGRLAGASRRGKVTDALKDMSSAKVNNTDNTGGSNINIDGTGAEQAIRDGITNTLNNKTLSEEDMRTIARKIKLANQDSDSSAESMAQAVRERFKAEGAGTYLTQQKYNELVQQINEG